MIDTLGDPLDFGGGDDPIANVVPGGVGPLSPRHLLNLVHLQFGQITIFLFKESIPNIEHTWFGCVKVGLPHAHPRGKLEVSHDHDVCDFDVPICIKKI